MSTARRDSAIPRYPSKEDCLEISNRAIGFATRKADYAGTEVLIMGGTTSSLRWARNQVTNGGEQTMRLVNIGSSNEGQGGSSTTNETTDAALKDTVLDAERLSGFTKKHDRGTPENVPLLGLQQYEPSNVFSAASAAVDTQGLSNNVKPQVETAVGSGFMSYGFMASWVNGTAATNTNKLVGYQAQTDVEFSCTVRSRSEGSGWAGLSHDDFGKIDVKAIMATAIDKCRSTQNPMRMEPGRHTLIMEAQALYDLFNWCFWGPIWGRRPAESGFGPYAAPGKKTKIGQQMLDRRITVFADPVDPGNNYRSFADDGSPMRRTVWFENGVLKELPYNRAYAVEHKLNNNYPMNGGISPSLPVPFHFTASGDSMTIQEMIASTRNGFMVTRLNGVFPTDFKSLACNGNTRDGLWYIENGKVKHPAKNFRIFESPFFILNEVDAFGPPQRVFTPHGAIMIPPVKVRYFNFSSLADAV
jgi:predicted Zn-dependent protease